MEFEKEINKWANTKVEESKREDSGSNELQREFTSDEVKDAIRVRREAHARYIGNNNAAGWDEYAKARKEVKKMVEKKKRGIWEERGS